MYLEVLCLCLCSLAGHINLLHITGVWWKAFVTRRYQTYQYKQTSLKPFLQTSSLIRPNTKDTNWHILPVLNKVWQVQCTEASFSNISTVPPISCAFDGVHSTGAAVSLRTNSVRHWMRRPVQAWSKLFWSEGWTGRKQWRWLQWVIARESATFDVVSVHTVHTHE